MALSKPSRLPIQAPTATINIMSKNEAGERNQPVAQAAFRAPFSAGSMVVVTLGNPRDKFWGMILSLAPEGLSIRGAELASFEDLVAMVKDGEPFTPAVVFFPMHRIERVELDLPDGSLPSLSQRFLAQTGHLPESAFGLSPASRQIEDALATVSSAARPKKDRA
jgi:hypothetical protein